MPKGAALDFFSKVEWQDRAACKGREDLFIWPEGGMTKKANQPQIKKALSICSTCPVLAECADWAKDKNWYRVIIAGQKFGGN